LLNRGLLDFWILRGKVTTAAYSFFCVHPVHLVSDVIPSGVLATSYNPRHESNNLHYHKTIANVAAHRIASQ
jgi:hypothetical protein